MVLGGLWHGAAWTFVALGGVPRRRAGGRARAGRPDRAPLPGWLRWLVIFNLVVFGWILFRSQDLGLFGDFLSAARRPPAPATLWTRPGRCSRSPWSSALQLLPAAPARAAAAADRAARPGRPRRRPGRRDPARRRDGPEPGRAALHLLPVLSEDQAWNSRTGPPGRQPDEPLRAAGAAALQRAPRRARDHVRGAACWFSSRAARCATPARRWTPGSAATSSSRSASRPAGSPTACRSPRRPTTRPPGSRPTTTAPRSEGFGSPDRRGRRRRRRDPAGHRRQLRPGRRSASAVRKGALETLLVTGDSLSTPLDQELARRLAGRGGVEVVRDPHLGTGISQRPLVDWGQLSANAGRRTRLPTRRWCSSAPTRATRCRRPAAAR